jgi:signal peptidase I
MEGDEQAAAIPDPGAAGEGKDEDEDEASSSRWIVELVGVVVVAILVAVLLRTFVVATYSIPSGSMEPTLQIGDRIVVDKLSYYLHGVDRGNIVVFTTPPNEDCAGPPVADLVKRVIGLPGEIISLQDGSVYINGRLLPEPFLPADVRTPIRDLRTRAMHCATRIGSPAGMSSSWATTGPTRATAATGGRSRSPPSSARSTCAFGPCPASGSSNPRSLTCMKRRVRFSAPSRREHYHR